MDNIFSVFIGNLRGEFFIYSSLGVLGVISIFFLEKNNNNMLQYQSLELMNKTSEEDDESAMI